MHTITVQQQYNCTYLAMTEPEQTPAILAGVEYSNPSPLQVAHITQTASHSNSSPTCTASCCCCCSLIHNGGSMDIAKRVQRKAYKRTRGTTARSACSCQHEHTPHAAVVPVPVPALQRRNTLTSRGCSSSAACQARQRQAKGKGSEQTTA
jgi:hypothetical protein